MHGWWFQLLCEVLIQDFLHEGVADVVELLEQLLNQVLGKKIDGAVVLEVVLEQELLIFVLNEVFGVVLPRAEIDL